MQEDLRVGSRAADGVSYRVPQHVVHRAYPEETVALNLKTGMYHSLNRTAGYMLELLGRVGDVDTAASEAAAHYQVDVDQVRSDFEALCAQLLEADLIEHDGKR